MLKEKNEKTRHNMYLLPHLFSKTASVQFGKHIYTHTCKINFITSLRFIFQKKKNKSSKLLYHSYKSNYYIFWQHHKKNQKASSTWLTICRWMDLVRSSVLESSSINNFLLISVALKDTVLLWDAVTHKHKNLSMSKRRWSCFDR